MKEKIERKLNNTFKEMKNTSNKDQKKILTIFTKYIKELFHADQRTFNFR